MSDCLFVDTFGYLWPCDPTLRPDPCMPEGATLFVVRECSADNPPFTDWCDSFPTHPVCVVNGLPKLPPTGAADTVAVIGSGMLFAGLLCLFAARRRAR